MKGALSTVVLIVALISFSSGYSDICVSESDGTAFKHPKSDKLFFICLNNDAFEVNCADNHYYEEKIGNCVLNAAVINNLREDSSSNNPCENIPGYAMVPSTTNCKNFYFCVNGEAFSAQCPDGQLFDQVMQGCFLAEDVDCNPFETTATTDKPTTTTTEATSTTEESTTTTEESTTEEPTTSEESTTITEESTTDEITATEGSTTTIEESTTEQPTTTEESTTTINESTTEKPTTTTEESTTEQSTTISEESTTEEPTTSEELTTITEESTTDEITATEGSTTTIEESTTEQPSTTTEESTTAEPTTTGVTAQPIPTTCPSTGIISIPNPHRCSRFRLCIYGLAFELACQAGHHFVFDSGDCQPHKNANCLIPIPVCDPTTTIPVLYPHPQYCDEFFLCIAGITTLLKCSAGYHFNVDGGFCTTATLGNCETINTLSRK